jgi:acyl carrier protein
VDSVRALDLIMFIEETFGITVENEEAVPENFDTVSNIVAYVTKKRAT